MRRGCRHIAEKRMETCWQVAARYSPVASFFYFVFCIFHFSFDFFPFFFITYQDPRDARGAKHTAPLLDAILSRSLSFFLSSFFHDCSGCISLGPATPSLFLATLVLGCLCVCVCVWVWLPGVCFFSRAFTGRGKGDLSTWPRTPTAAVVGEPWERPWPIDSKARRPRVRKLVHRERFGIRCLASFRPLLWPFHSLSAYEIPLARNLSRIRRLLRHLLSDMQYAVIHRKGFFLILWKWVQYQRAFVLKRSSLLWVLRT